MTQTETGIGRGRTHPTLEGRDLVQKVAPRNLGFEDFLKNLCRNGLLLGALDIQIFHPPSKLLRFDTPYPGLQVTQKVTFGVFPRVTQSDF